MSNCDRWFRRQHWHLKHYGERQDSLRRRRWLEQMAQRAHLPVALLSRARQAARDVLHLARSGPVRSA